MRPMFDDGPWVFKLWKPTLYELAATSLTLSMFSERDNRPIILGGGLSWRGRSKPANPIKRAARKRQRKARAITRKAR